MLKYLVYCLILFGTANTWASTIKLGVYHNPPKLFLSEQGDVKGIFGELLLEIARQEQWTIEPVACQWEDCLALLQQNQINLLPDVAPNAERRALFVFHDEPVLHSWSQVFQHQSQQIDSILDLNQKQLAVLSGSVQQRHLEQLMSEFGIVIHLLEVDTLVEGLEAVEEQRVDGLVTNHLFGSLHADAYDMTETSIMFGATGLYFAANPQWPQHTQTLSRIDHWLHEWKTAPQSFYHQVISGWKPAKIQPFIPTSLWATLALLIVTLLFSSWLIKILRKQARHFKSALLTTHQHLSVILENLDTYVYIKDTQFRYTYVSKSVCQRFQAKESEIIGKTAYDFFDAETAANIHDFDQRVLIQGERVIEEERNRIQNEHNPVTFLSIKTPLRNEKGEITGVCGISTDITLQTQYQEEVHQLIFFDLLTGLPNRKFIVEHLSKILKAEDQPSMHGFIVMIDLDNFRDLNDTFGHDAGDKYLNHIAKNIKKQLRSNQTLGRFGGDEFVLIAELTPSQAVNILDHIQRTLVRVKHACSDPFNIDSKAYLSSISMGISLFSDAKKGAVDGLKQAELAMYDAKKAGRNQIRFFDFEMQEQADKRTELEAGIRKGLDSQEFCLYYQSQHEADGSILGYEALVRWVREGVVIPPSDFIPQAEQSGLIIPLGQWILKTACEQLAKWKELPDKQHLSIAVNISAVQFQDPKFAQQVISLLDQTQAPADRLELEITESMLISDLDKIIDILLLLKTRGIRFSLDDFGTGYSSLDRLTNLPLDQLKIDQRFVRNLDKHSRDAAVVKTIIDLGRNLGLSVIAEGVETDNQRERLLELGCYQFQGYLFAKPALLPE